MKKELKPVALKNAPMDYTPTNELSVVFLFANMVRRLGFKIETIRSQYFYQMFLDRNPRAIKNLTRFRPDRL